MALTQKTGNLNTLLHTALLAVITYL